MPHETGEQIRGTVGRLVIESACRDFIDEQLRREPFCSVSQLEGKLHTLTSRLGGVERALGVDSEKIVLLERLSAEADGEDQPVEPGNIGLGHHSDSSTGMSCKGPHPGQPHEVSDLLAGFRSQRRCLRDLIEGRDYGGILDEIHRHLEGVMSSEPTRRQDQTALSTLEKEVEELRRSSRRGLRRGGNNLLAELQQALGNEHAHADAAYGARFRLFFETLYGFLAGAHWQVYNLFAPLIGAEAENGLPGGLKQAARGAQAAVAYSTRLLSCLGAFCGSLTEGWMGSARVPGRTHLIQPQVILGWDVPQYPARRWLMAMLVPVIVALSCSVFSSINAHPPVTTPSQHVAPSESSRPPDVSHSSPIPPAHMAEPVTTTQGDCLEEDFWRSLLEG